jgi:dienelactone hydrolase
MAEVLLFHHSQGLTAGVLGFAGELRAAGHTVHTPDLFEGRTFASIDDGMTYIRSVGSDELMGRGARAAEALPAELVYAGFSFGVMPAQQLAQTRPGARGALLFESCAPTSEFGSGWPAGVPVQVHGMDNDPFFAEEGGDIDAARALVAEAERAELFLYPGTAPLHRQLAAPRTTPTRPRLLTKRAVDFLDSL